MLRFLHKIEKPRRRKCFKKFQGNSLPFFEYFRLNSTVWCPRRGAGDRDPNAVYGAAEIGHNQYFFRTYFYVCASVPELERRCAKSFILKLVYPCISFSRRVRVRAATFYLTVASVSLWNIKIVSSFYLLCWVGRSYHWLTQVLLTHTNYKTFFPVAVEAEHSLVEFCKGPACRGWVGRAYSEPTQRILMI